MLGDHQSVKMKIYLYAIFSFHILMPGGEDNKQYVAEDDAKLTP